MTDNGPKPGQRVRVTQEIDRREGAWQGRVEGTVVSVGAEKSGSWFAHSKDARLWLRRIRLQKDDGEITTLTIDPHTRVEILGGPAEAN